MVPLGSVATSTNRRPGPGDSLQRRHRGRRQRRFAAGRQLGHGHQNGRRTSAERELPQGMNLQWTELTLLADPRRQHGDHRLRGGGGAGVSGAGGAVRKPHACRWP